ncbi:hypothetical protein N866_09350 [Actinotalea ferrariae CF5-4]|uniref:Uncharacterized protein n=1 Tax=Actinotalea ferrariae CF5-4 TaxID=948458 RepID=A0A021VMH2_9CELL|nr:hypothetical protein N866_09350 [Actinotalea ferrariae CF5-4]
MAPVVLALVVALAVLVLSAVVSTGRPAREVLTDARDALRGGLARERWTTAGTAQGRGPGGGARTLPRAGAVLLRSAAVDDDLDDDETSVTDLFDLGRPDPQGYVRADRLATALERAQGAVADGVQQVQHRVRR